MLNKKKREQDREELKAAQRDVKHCVREAKDTYRRKLEQKLKENNMSYSTVEKAKKLNKFFT